MAINKRLKQLREEKGLQQKQIADALCVRQPTVSDWESGKQEPNPQHRKKLAELFGITVSELYSAKRPSKENELFKAPILSFEQVNNSDNIVPYDAAQQFVFTTEKGKDMFALLVQSDMMEPEFVEGDCLIVKETPQAENGDFIIVQDPLISRARFKQLKIYGEKKILHPLNPKYDDIDFDASIHRIIGIVIAKQKKYK